MAKHIAYKSSDNGKFFLCLLDKGVMYGPCVFCNTHRDADSEHFCKAIQYWDNSYDCYTLFEN